MACDGVCPFDVGRTNIDIDDELLAGVMLRYQVTTKRDPVDLAPRRATGKVWRGQGPRRALLKLHQGCLGSGATGGDGSELQVGEGVEGVATGVWVSPS
jgi:Arc/MetJ family transcription regulator